MNAPLDVRTRRRSSCARMRDGVATLTLNRPAQFNALSRGDARGAASRARRHRPRRDRARRGHRGRRARVLRRPRSQGAARAIPPTRVIGDLFRALQQRDADVAAAAAAGHRASARHRDRRRLPARRRSCDLAVAADDARFATSGHQLRALLRDARRFRVVAQRLAQAGDRDAADRRVHRCADGARTGDSSIAWCRPTRSTPRSRRLSASSSTSRGRVLALGKEFFYRQLEQPLEQAYADASSVITFNMLGDDAQEGVDAFVEKRKPRWED